MDAPSLDLPPGSVAVVLGTRPEAVKLAGVVRLLGPAATVVHSGQHWAPELAAGVLEEVGFPAPDATLDVGGGSRGAQLGQVVARLDARFADRPPLAVVVQGDTTTTLGGALAANAAGVPVVHVEAGLRSFDRRMPEEHNRVLTDHLADLCCAPTEVSRDHLVAEGIAAERVEVTGNTVVEAVGRLTPPPPERAAHLAAAGVEPDRFVLATLHRPENVDDAAVLGAVLDELAALPLPVVLPLHPRTAARAAGFGLDGALARLRVCPPLTPRPFLALAAEAALWVSDSGGLQEEASVLKRPVVVVRASTERPEVQGTFAVLVPPGPGIGEAARAWLDDLPAVHARLAGLPTPYGDGSASARTVAALGRLLGVAGCG
ncbi:MAG TPA: UDP-N-acetylglucosamine 2-epimerase (non-hydrolyzing) [Acidimicrobiales bacterium]